MTNAPDRYVIHDDQGNTVGSHQRKLPAISHCKAHARRFADYHVYVVDTKTDEIIFQFGQQLSKALDHLLNPTA